MHRRAPANLERKSKPFTPAYLPERKTDPRLEGYSYMLIEDVKTYVMPTRGFPRYRDQLAISLEPDDSATINQVVLSLGKERYPSGSGLERVVSDLIADLAFRLAYQGAIHFEIASTTAPQPRSDSDRGYPVGEELPAGLKMPLRIPGRTINLGIGIIQILPKMRLETTGGRFAWIHRSKIWTCRLPRELRGRWGFKLTQGAIRASSRYHPAYLDDQGSAWFEDPHLDLGKFFYSQQALLANATSYLGWSARMLWRDRTLEFYQFYREVQFARSMSVLRMHIVDLLNDLLPRLNIHATLSIKGLPTPEDLDLAISNLQEGKIDFQGVMDLIGI